VCELCIKINMMYIEASSSKEQFIKCNISELLNFDITIIISKSTIIPLFETTCFIRYPRCDEFIFSYIKTNAIFLTIITLKLFFKLLARSSLVPKITKVVEKYIYKFSEILLKYCSGNSLKCSQCIIRFKGHNIMSKSPLICNIGGKSSIFLRYLNLIMVKETIQKEIVLMDCKRIYYNINKKSLKYSFNYINYFWEFINICEIHLFENT